MTLGSSSQVALNVGGALLAGIALGIEEHEQSDVTQRRIANLFRGGFIGVFTNLAWSLQQACDIATDEKSDQTELVENLVPPALGSLLFSSRQTQAASFVVGLFCLGTAVNFVGYRIGASVFGPLTNATSPRRRKTHAGVGGSLARFLPPLMAAYILSCLSQALMYPDMAAPNGTTYHR